MFEQVAFPFDASPVITDSGWASSSIRRSSNRSGSGWVIWAVVGLLAVLVVGWIYRLLTRKSPSEEAAAKKLGPEESFYEQELAVNRSDKLFR